MTNARKRGEVLAVVVIAGLVGALLVAALRSDGARAANLDLNDAGVWISKGNEQLVGRVNTEISQLDSKVVAGTASELLQQGSDVLVRSGSTMQSLDVRMSTAGEKVPVPGHSRLALGPQQGALLDVDNGRLFVLPPQQLATTTFATTQPTGAVSGALDVTVAADGTTWVLSPQGLVSVRGGVVGEPKSVGAPIHDGAVTAVANEPVVLDRTASVLRRPGAPPTDLARLGAGLVLQQPSKVGGSVLVAGDAGLGEVDLNSGALRVIAPGTRRPIAPVRVARCAYGAWQEPARVVSSCGATQTQNDLAGVTGPLAFRVNRDRVVLNGVDDGVAYMLDGGAPQRVDNWGKVDVPQHDTREDPNATRPNDRTRPTDAPFDRSQPNRPPTAVDDQFGARSGRAQVVHPLRNDSDPDGDVLTVVLDTTTLPKDAKVEVVDGGQAVQVTPSATFTGPIRFAYTADDGRGGRSNKATVTVTVTPVDGPNSAPKPKPDRLRVEAGHSASVNVLANDEDPEGDGLLLSSVGPPDLAAWVQMQPTGAVTVRPPADTPAGLRTLTYTVRDDLGAESTDGRLEVEVLPPGTGQPPKAVNDLARGVAGREQVVDLLANDSDPNGNPLSVIQIQPQNDVATATLDGQRYLRVLPRRTGSFDLIYSVTNGEKVSQALVRVDIAEADPTQQPVAVRDDVVARPGVPVVVDVVANDFDPNGDVLVLQSVATANGFVVEPIDHHLVRLTAPPGFDHTTSLTYTVTNGVTQQAVGVIVVHPAPISAVNQAPILQPDEATVRAGSSISIPVLRNDMDPDGDELTLLSVTPPPRGDGLLFVQGRELRYVAPDGERGGVHARYTVTDTAGNRVDGDVVIRVLPRDPARNTPPRTPPLTLRTIAGQEATVEVPLQTMDPEGDIVLFNRIVESPRKGTVSVGESGRLTYRADPSASGPDRFTYEVQDEYGAKATGAVAIGIAPRVQVNSQPIAVPDRVTVQVGQERAIPVLKNDTDIDGDTLSLGPELGVPRLGRARVEGDVVVYTAPPTIDRDGTSVSFSYQVEDGRGGRASGLVTVTLRNEPAPVPPIARDDQTEPHAPGEVVEIPVLANDENPGGALTELNVAVENAPDVEVVGQNLRLTTGQASRTLVYSITNRQGLSARAVVRVPVVADRAPLPETDLAETTQETPVRVPVLANDRDPAGRTLHLTRVVASRGGDAKVDGDVVVFTPSAGFVGDGGFSYEVTNGSLTATGDARITVRGSVNRPPTMTGLDVEVSAGGSREVDLSTAISDPDPGDRPTVADVSGGGAGLDVVRSGNRLRISAAPSARGMQTSLTVTIDDGHPGGRAQGTVAIRVTSSDKPPPVAVDDDATGNQGQAVTVAVLDNDTDPVGGGLHVVRTSSPAAVVAGNSLTFTPAADFFGTTSFTYTMRDVTNDPQREATATVRITIRGRPAKVNAPSGTRESGAVVLQWQAPAMNGGQFKSYEVETDVGGARRTASSTSLKFDGLTNGTSYRFRVKATNEAGDGDWSEWSPPYVPDALPSVPGAPTLTFGDRQLKADWSAPANQGTPIIEYQLQLNPGGATRTVAAPATSFTWTGLTNGQAYTIRLRARNDAGWTDYGTSGGETPAAPPDMTSPPTVTRGDKQASVSWTPATSNGDAVDRYQLTLAPGGQVVEHTDLSSLQHIVTGLTNGTSYTATLKAHNKAGWGAGTSSSFVPAGAPAAPTGVTATAGVRQATVSWTVPSDNGDRISRFEVTATGGASGMQSKAVSGPSAGSTDSLTFGGLGNGVNVQFWVKACNAVQCSADSAISNSVTTPNVPGAPTMTGVSNRTAPDWIDISWSTPGDGGSGITGYRVFIDGNAAANVTGNSYRHNGLSYGQSHTYSVLAANAVGDGPMSNTVTGYTQDPPPPPVVPTVTVSEGGQQMVAGCTSTSCRWVVVTARNFAPGAALGIDCYSTKDTIPYYSYRANADGFGNSTSQQCVFGFPGAQVWVVVNGVESNRITWR